MKCPNCRCVIPNHSYRCVYCGHTVQLYDETTAPVQYRQAYANRNGRDYYRAHSGQTNYYDIKKRRRHNAPRSRAYYYGNEAVANRHRLTAYPISEPGYGFAVASDNGGPDIIKSLMCLIAVDILFILLLLLLVLVLVL